MPTITWQEPISLTKALSRAFNEDGPGKKSLGDFVKELKALTPEDKEWFKNRFEIEGYGPVAI